MLASRSLFVHHNREHYTPVCQQCRMTVDLEERIEAITLTLKMPGLRRVFREKARNATETGLSPFGCLGAEIANRQQNELRRNLAAARFPVAKTLDTFEFTALPSLSREMIRDLSGGRVWAERENVLLVGQVGTGKTHISRSLWESKPSRRAYGSGLSPLRR